MQGYFDWKVRQGDRIVTIKVTRKDVEKFINWDNSHGKLIQRQSSSPRVPY